MELLSTTKTERPYCHTPMKQLCPSQGPGLGLTGSNNVEMWRRWANVLLRCVVYHDLLCYTHLWHHIQQTSWSGNRHDPMKIQSGWRDKFPKTDMTGGYIGDGYPLCVSRYVTDICSCFQLLLVRVLNNLYHSHFLLGGPPRQDVPKEACRLPSSRGISYARADGRSFLVQEWSFLEEICPW